MSALHEAFTNKLPPQDLDAERSAIGSIMFDGRCLDHVSEVIKPDDFYLDAHTKLYQAILTIAEAGGVIDAVTVANELRKREEYEEIGGERYLIQVLESVYHAGHARYHAEIVRSYSIKRKVITTTLDALSKAYQEGIEVEDLMRFVDVEFGKLLESTSKNASKTFKQIAINAIDRLTSPREEGIKLGFRELDEMLFGAKPGQVIVLAARPGVGKSALAGNIARFVARFAGVLFCSIEMPEDEMLDRAVVSELGVSMAELRPMARDEEGRDGVLEALNALSGLPITIDDSADQSIASISQQARLAKRNHGLGLIIVDYLQLIRPENKKNPREQQVSEISWGLKRLAKNLGVPVLALAQLNREIEKRADKSPQLSDLRESGSIEQNANTVLMLDRPANWDDQRNEDEAIVYVRKNRGGRTGRVDLKWDGRSATFKDPEFLAAGFNVNDIDMDAGYDPSANF